MTLIILITLHPDSVAEYCLIDCLFVRKHNVWNYTSDLH